MTLTSNTRLDHVVRTARASLFLLLGAAAAAWAGSELDPARAESIEDQSVQLTLSAAETKCRIRTADGHYVTAVDGGGHAGDALHTDATGLGDYETFWFVEIAGGVDARHPSYALRSFDGHYVSAADGGGRDFDAIHTDATSASSWETFTLSSHRLGAYAIRSFDGHYLTATGGGGRVDGAFHTDVARIGDWELFSLVCEL